MTTPKSSWSSVLNRWLPAVSDWPLLTAGEQTKLSWARRIESAAEVPPFYAGAVDALIAEIGRLPYLVLSPSFAQFIARTTEKLICLLPGEVRILEKTGSVPRVTAFAWPDISRVEVGCVLLKSWLTLTGRTTAGEWTTLTVKYNTVTDYLFWPIIERARCTGEPVRTDLHADPDAQRAKFNYLAHDYYKFMNAAKKTVLPGATVVDSLMQPEIRKPLFTVFGHAYLRLQAPAHIIVLTDHELIVVAEEHLDAWSGETKYGSVGAYIPLRSVCDATLSEPEPALVRLTVALPGEEFASFDFTPDRRPALEQLLAEIKGQRLLA